ncbi:MAG: methyl-accepting chemotaxis protein, partial [Ktedonobacteraceae bacterium]|nr:methyl-accepting chemotaxis protein [Ktedonobacteraceae bacterium]
VPSLIQFMQTPPPPQTPQATYTDIQQHALYSLAAGSIRDKRYQNWSAYDTKGEPVLYYPKLPQKHGQFLVPPTYLQAVKTGTIISDVYYDPAIQQATVDIYSPIATTDHTYLGFMRATLSLDYIWTIVKDDVNGAGSYAFIVDQHGIRIADPDPNQRFSSVAALPDDLQQQIQQEARFGNTNPVPTIADPAAVQGLNQGGNQGLFQAQPAGKNEPFQVVRYNTSVVPWNYFVLSPISTVTASANQQLLLTGIATALVVLAMMIIGPLIGRNVGRPIMRSVDSLRRSSESMSSLATRQQDAASEQMWVVDSSQVGLQSVQYYAEATTVAARELARVAGEMAQRWRQLGEREAHQALEKLVTTARYIEQASQYQNQSSQKLSTALKVATQVTEQLVAGTTSATDAATQMERVVTQLRNVVGK